MSKTVSWKIEETLTLDEMAVFAPTVASNLRAHGVIATAVVSKPNGSRKWIANLYADGRVEPTTILPR